MMEQMTEGFGCNDGKGCGSDGTGVDGDGGEGNWGCGVVQSAVGSYLGETVHHLPFCNSLIPYLLGFLIGNACLYRVSCEGGDVQMAIAGPVGSRGIRSCNMSQLLNVMQIFFNNLISKILEDAY